MMSAPSTAVHDSFPGLSVLQSLPIPLLILSSHKKVLVATGAVKKLLAWPSRNQEHSTTLVGCSLGQIGVVLPPEQGREAQDLDAILDHIAREGTNVANTTWHSSQLTEDDDLWKGGGEDPEPLSTTGDTMYDAWPDDDWCGTPALGVLVNVQRGLQSQRIICAELSVRMWFTGETTLYVLTFAKPPTAPSSVKLSSTPPISKKDARNGKKLTTLAQMKMAVFDQAQIPTYLFSADETMYYPNQAGKPFLGQIDQDYSLEDGYQILTRLDLWDETYTRRLDFTEHPGIKLVRTRQSFKEHKYGFIHPRTGKRVRLDLSGDCLYDEITCEFLGGVVWCRDVTVYTEVIAQQQLEIERGFENKLDHMPNLSWTARPDGEPDYFSKRWYCYTHARRNEALKDIWTRTVHPEDKDAVWDSWIQCTQKGQAFTTEARYKRHDGMYRYQLVQGVPQRNDTGEIVKWHGACADIHDLVMQRMKASRLKQQMIVVLSHAEVNLFGFDTQMAVTMLEGSMKWGTQESATEKAALVGGELVDVVESTTIEGASGAADFIGPVQRVLRGDSTMEIFEHSLDQRWYRTRVIADVEASDGSGCDIIRGALGLSIDITDMKARTALELEKTQLVANETAAKEANMLKSQFLANVSHELRTPISGVIGMADLLAETPLSDEQREYGRGISQSADSLLGIVNDILDASKIEAGRFDIESVEFNLSRVLGDLYTMMAHAAQKKRLTLEYKTLLSPLERVIGDPGRTRQILVNLLTNAIKFTSEGTITLSVSASDSEDDTTVVFIVEDTGIGIEDAVLQKLFKPFSQGDSSTARLFGGTGLGLTICKELASLMHGSISLESQLGVGSRATLSVPFGRPLSRRPSKETAVSAGAPFHDIVMLETGLVSDLEAHPLRRLNPGIGDGIGVNGIEPTLSRTARARTQVLVVEDNTINQKIVVQIIKKLGFPVKAVWNGKEALEYLAHPTAATPRPHIVLMDCQMPIMDGYEATCQLRNSADLPVDESLRKVPVIALTASAIKGDKEKCESAGMDDYITKPVTKQNLERVLVRWTLRSQKLER